MPVELRLEEVSFQSLLRGTTFTGVSDSTPNLVANIGEVILSSIKLSLTWYTGTDQGYTVKQVLLDSGTPQKVKWIRSSGSFRDDGLRVGDRVINYFNWERRFDAPNLSGYAPNAGAINDITFISEDGKTLEFEVVSFLNNYTSFIDADSANNVGLWADATLTENAHLAAEFAYNLIQNESDFETQGLQSDADQTYYQAVITSGGGLTNLLSKGINKSWLSGFFSGGNLQTGLIVTDGSVIQTNAQGYRISHYFLVNPLYLIGQLENFENSIVPSYLAGDRSFKYAYEVDFRRALTNVNSSKINTFTNNLGAVGWYNENFNGYNNIYEVTSVSYQDVSTGDTVTGVQINAQTDVTIVITKTDGNFDSAVRAQIQLFRIPNTEDEYKETETNLLENFIYDFSLLGSTGSFDGVYITNQSRTVNADTLTLVVRVDYSSNLTQQLRISNTDRFVLSVLTEDPTLDIEDSDRVNLLVDVGTYSKGAFIPGLITFSSLNLVNVNGASISEAESTIDAFNESNIVVSFSFSLDLNKSAFLTDLRFLLVAKNSAGNFFQLDEFVFDLSSVVVKNGIQEININSSRGYLLPDADLFDSASIQLGVNAGGFQVYTGTLGQKIKWQDWLQNSAVDTVFFDTSKPNNNLNFKTSNYSNLEDYEIFILAQSSLTGVDDNGVAGEGFDQSFSGELTIRDYEVGYGNTISGTIEFLDPDTLAVSDSILKNKNTLVRVTYNVAAVAADLADYWAVVRIQETGSPGDDIEELTTDKGVKNILKGLPLAKSFLNLYEDSGNIITECEIDYTRLNTQAGYDVSAEIAEKASGFTGNAVITAEGDFVETAETDIVLTAEN